MLTLTHFNYIRTLLVNILVQCKMLTLMELGLNLIGILFNLYHIFLND